jgi:hypothetical protein
MNSVETIPVAGSAETATEPAVSPETSATATPGVVTPEAVLPEPGTAAAPEPAHAVPEPAAPPVAPSETDIPLDTPGTPETPVETAPPVALGIVRSARSPHDAGVSLVRHPKPMPLDRFWDAVARCETGGDWKNPGRYAGGLGIYIQSWTGWGGREFAPAPDAAAPHEQIIVANRISTQGWTRPDNKYVAPVGFSGWGCIRKMGPPELLTFHPESVIAQPFTWKQRGEVVRDLQAILDLPRDGVYGPRTWESHVSYLKARQLPRTLAPVTPSHVAPAMLTE